MNLTAKEQQLMEAGAMAATQQYIHMIKDLGEGRSPSTSYWGSKALKLKVKIESCLQGDSVAFEPYRKEYLGAKSDQRS